MTLSSGFSAPTLQSGTPTDSRAEGTDTNADQRSQQPPRFYFLDGHPDTCIPRPRRPPHALQCASSQTEPSLTSLITPYSPACPPSPVPRPLTTQSYSHSADSGRPSPQTPTTGPPRHGKPSTYPPRSQT